LKTKLAFIVLIAGAVFVTANAHSSDTAASASNAPAWERPLHKVDGFLQEGLGEDSHRALAGTFSDSAGFLRDVGGNVSNRLQGDSE
jgi:hypothetical protein